MVPVAEERLERVADYAMAAVNATVAFFVFALLGLIAGASLGGTHGPRDGESSLRRVSFALPSAYRGDLSPLVQAVERGQVGATARLRDQLASSIAEVEQASWEEDRAASARIEVRRARLVEQLRRRGGASSSDYRTRGPGSIVVTLVLQHAVELPDLPTVVRPGVLPDLFASLLPANPRQLDAARALLHPADPAQTFDDVALARAFPELRPLSRGEALRSG